VPDNDIEKLKEFMYRSSEQLNYLTKKVDEMDAKLTLIVNDVVILKTKAWAFGILGGVVVTAVFQFLIAFLNK